MNTKLLIIITADTNDADYISSHHYITQEELPRLISILKVIRNLKHEYNWDNSDYTDQTPQDMYQGSLSVEDIDWFDGLVPFGENGIHMIESIKLYHVINENTLF